MNQWKRLVTAGAGATVALTLVIGPGGVAHADPGGRGSHSGPSDHRDDSGRRGGEGSLGVSSSNDDDTGSGDEQNSSNDSRRPSMTTADGARTVRTARTARTADDVSTGGSGLRPVVPVAPSRVDAPQLVTPAGVADIAPSPRSRMARVSPPAPVFAPPAIPVSITPPQPVGLQVADMGLPALPIGAEQRPGQPMTSLFGILGLLLIPLAGAALGYRQARAARAAGALPRT